MIAAVLLALVVLLVAGKLGGAFAERLGQPAVLGELLAGIALGALPLLGVHDLAYMAHDATVESLAEIGVILLLFEVGLSTRLADLMKVGTSAFLVATIGVVVPMALGWAAGRWLMPDSHPYVALFLGATLCATSVGITARVLSDMGRVATAEGQIILGAAVIDDVMGLLVLAVIVGLVGGGGSSGTGFRIGMITAKAITFLVGALVLGRWLSPILFRGASRLRGKGVIFTAALVTCFALAWMANLAGLAPIVGAFAAGLVLEGVPFDELLPEGESMEHLLLPLSAVLVPLFFVHMGLLVNLHELAGGSVVLAVALIVAAVVGKQACALAVVTRGADRIAVGLGMIPRGEVGLIFAGMGLRLEVAGKPLLSGGDMAAVVAMVLATTVLTPPLLRWRMGRLTPASATSS